MSLDGSRGNGGLHAGVLIISGFMVIVLMIDVEAVVEPGKRMKDARREWTLDANVVL